LIVFDRLCVSLRVNQLRYVKEQQVHHV